MAENNTELKPCPFCGGAAELETMATVRSVIRCTNTQCYLHCNPWRSWNNGDTDEHARLRLTTWWNNRPGEDALKEKHKKELTPVSFSDVMRAYQQKYGENDDGGE